MQKKKTGKKQRRIQGSNTKTMTRCIRCGTCCKKGGPALHREDRQLVIDGHIGYAHLVTIRKGEPAYSPISGKLEPVKKELIKIAGKGKGWTCIFYDEKKSSCAVYEKRPLECRLLKCWDTSKLLSVIGEGTITRGDIISRNDPVIKFIEMHEKECSVQMAEDLISALTKKKNDSNAIAELTTLVNMDMDMRSIAISEFSLSLKAELFIFGRPLFKILGTRGISVYEANGEIVLSLDKFNRL